MGVRRKAENLPAVRAGEGWDLDGKFDDDGLGLRMEIRDVLGNRRVGSCIEDGRGFTSEV